MITNAAGRTTGPPRLLAVGPALDGSSYARVVESTLEPLAAMWEIVHVGVNYYGPPVGRVVPNEDRFDRYAAATTLSIASSFEPDVIFVFDSFLDLPRYRHLPRGPKLVAQCPILGEPEHPFLIERLAFYDCVVVLSEGVRKFIGDRLPNVAVIPHGFDASLFHPQREPHDGFVVLNANRRFDRKRLDITREGFELFARGKSDVTLILHNDGNLSDAELNRLYNACDVGINTSTGEGWGMVSFEHAATGAAQIVPDAWVCGEVWREHAVLLPTTPAAGRFTRENVVSAEDVAEALERLYRDRGYLAEMSKRALALANDPRFQWRAIASQWDAVLRSTISPPCTTTSSSAPARPVACSQIA
jgi:glycosyltransferase involved in cell wall biosynthesis